MRGERRGSVRGRDAETNELAFGWCAGAVVVLVFEPTARAILTAHFYSTHTHANIILSYSWLSES